MHDQVREFLRRVDARLQAGGRWPMASGARVVEFGSFNVNGSARDVLGSTSATWTGVDWRPGPGVDVVSLAHAYRPTTDDGRETTFDLAVSTEMLEHDPFWQESLRRMIEAIRPGGNVLLTCAGPERPAHEVRCAPTDGQDQRPYYQGLGLGEVLAWSQECSEFDVLYGEQHSAPSDTYVALIGRRTHDDGPCDWGRRPTVSVVVPCVGNVELTRRCVASLRAMTTGPWELVLIENGSKPENREALADVALERWNGRTCRVTFLSWDRMLGYPAAVNRGIAAARGEYVCLLNNDTEIRTPGWDTLLLESLEGHDGDVVSPVTDYIANPEQAGRWEDGEPPRPAQVLFFVCVMMRRELFTRVGPLDEEFGLGNGEDREFCARVQRYGGRLLVDPGVFVHHEGHGTFRRLPAGMFDALLERNRALYREKVARSEIAHSAGASLRVG